MTIRFTWNGALCTARNGDSIAAALTSAGLRTLGRGRAGRNRAMFCGMGVCQDCVVEVDGETGRLACMTKVREGMRVAAQDDGVTEPRPAREARPAPERHAPDVVVIGAGPAGLAAALSLKQSGLDVLVVDERDAAGGQYFKPRTAGYRGATAPDEQHREGDALRARAAGLGITVLTGQTVWFARRAEDRFDLRSVGTTRDAALRPRALLLAAGGYEIPAMVPGWTLPGVMTIGAAQTLARRYGVAPKGRIVIAGNGPLGWQLASELARLGADVVALAERATLRRPAALAEASLAAPGLVATGIAQRADFLRRGIPVLTGWELSAVEGGDQATHAVLRHLPTGDTRRIAAETICMGEGFAPQLEIARLLDVPLTADAATGDARPERDAVGRTASDGLWIAGDAGGMGGARVAAAEATLAAIDIAETLGAVPRPRPELRRLARARRFQAALWRLFDAPPRGTVPEDAIVCRCEAVDARAVRAAIADGAGDPGAIKRATRLGMGRCQGRYCLTAARKILTEAGHDAPLAALFAPQVPIKPVSVAALTREKPEWGGHRESSPAARPAQQRRTPLEPHEADLLVVGGGVTGLSAALFAAREGARVTLLDRGRLGAEASGGNAGSLHLQLLSWDFGTKAVGGGDLQLRTLPLQAEAIDLWSDLERDLGAAFEIHRTGGLVVAETRAQIPFLEAKAAAEARVGIETEVIDAARLRRIAPHVSERMVAAAWCPGEGKINPLAATNALIAAARAAGVRFEENTAVTGIARDGAGYSVATDRGTIAAPRLILAAGGWSAALGAMLGCAIPVKGAPLQMVVTERTAPILPCLVAHADRHLTMKQTDAGTILIGGAWTAETGPTGQARVLPDSLEGNLWVAARTVPSVAGLRVLRSWAAMNIDIDGAPLIGPLPGAPGVTVAATANGYTLGPLMGREAAAISLSGRVRQDLAPFTFDRFHKGPP